MLSIDRRGRPPSNRLKPLADRLVGAFALVGLAVFLVLVGANLLRRGPFSYFGADFLAYYVAGGIVRDGRSVALFDPQLQVARQRASLAGLGIQYEPGGYPLYLNPPLLAALCVPFSLLPLVPALALWELLGLTCAAISVF